MNAIADLTCSDLSLAYRRGELSPVEVARDCLARIDAHAALNAFMPIEPERVLAAAAESETRWRAGAPLGSDRRRADDDQGQYLGQGLADPARLENQRRHAGASRRAGGRAPARAGRGHPRQDLHARARLDRRLPFAADRHHPQSVESGSHARRFDRRWRGCRLARPRRAASRHRRRRFAAHSGRLHRRVRHEAELRPGAGLSAVAAQRAGAPRADHPQGCRRRADAVGDRAAGRARHDGLEYAGAGFQRRARRGRARLARGVLGPARAELRARSRDRSGGAQGGARAGRAGRHCRGGRPAARRARAR